GDRGAVLPGSENHRIRRLEPPRPDRLHEQIVQPVQLFVDVFEHEDVRTGSAASLAHPGKVRTADARSHEAEVSPAGAAPGAPGRQTPGAAAGEASRAVGVVSALCGGCFTAPCARWLGRSGRFRSAFGPDSPRLRPLLAPSGLGAPSGPDTPNG